MELKMTDCQDEDVAVTFLDISVKNQYVGRIVIKLFKQLVPKSVENFRALCTGEKGIGTLGKPLHYKNSFFHRTIPDCLVQAGDITHYDGSGGESIFGLFFNDENFKLQHAEPGVVSMANTGNPNTNNSQFFITVAPCEHLDGSNVAIGKVIKGFKIAQEISETEAENSKPFVKYEITNCGELPIGADYGINECDGTTDTYPPWPQDWDVEVHSLKESELIRVVTNIKDSGNEFYKQSTFFTAGRKYRKAIEYLKWYSSEAQKYDVETFNQIETSCLLNLSAVKLKMELYNDCVQICDEVLDLDRNNVKAIFRKGQANVLLNNQEIGLELLRNAHRLVPYDKDIISEIRKVKKCMNDYLKRERNYCAKMFQK